METGGGMETEAQAERGASGWGGGRNLSMKGLSCHHASRHTPLQTFPMHSSLKKSRRVYHIKGHICMYEYANLGSCLTEILLGELKIT